MSDDDIFSFLVIERVICCLCLFSSSSKQLDDMMRSMRIAGPCALFSGVSATECLRVRLLQFLSNDSNPNYSFFSRCVQGHGVSHNRSTIVETPGRIKTKEKKFALYSDYGAHAGHRMPFAAVRNRGST